MTPEDLVKIGASEAFKPYNNLIEKLLGPAFEQAGLALGARVGLWSVPLQARFFNKYREYMEKAEVEIRPVPPKLLVPILQNAFIEEDEDLQSLWAALLANASSPSVNQVPVMFMEILRQLSREDALFLRALMAKAIEAHTGKDADRRRAEILSTGLGLASDLFKIFWTALPPGGEDNMVRFDLSIGNVLRLGLLRDSREVSQIPERFRPASGAIHAADYFYFTGLGLEFLKACESPAQQQSMQEDECSQ